MTYSISFSPESIKEITAFAGFPTLLSTEVQGAMQEGSQLLVQAIRDAMHWENPTGELSDSIMAITDSPYEVQVGSNDPKARRRDLGFSGMTDRLGRYYPNDPGAFFMSIGMQSQQDAVLQLIYDAVDRALGQLGGSNG